MTEEAQDGFEEEVAGFVYFLIPLKDPLSPPEGFELSFDFTTTVNQEISSSAIGGVPFFGPTSVVSLKFWNEVIEDGSPFDIDLLMGVAEKAFPISPGGSGEEGGYPIPKTVVEAAVQVDDFSGERPDDLVIDLAFDRALHCIRNFQRAYGLMARRSVILVTRERSPVCLPMIFRSGATSEAEGSWSEFVEMYSPNYNVHGLVREELDEAMIEKIRFALDHYQSGRAFLKYTEFARQALASRQKDGDYKVAVVLAATAVETLLDDLLMHLLWEEARDPQDASAVFSGWLTARVKKEFHVRLGGSWRVDSDGPIKEWSENLAGMRNRILHAGYDPSREEADAALGALFSIEKFLIDRVSAKRAKYPRTALMMISEPVLSERNQLSGTLRNVMEDENETDWSSTFGRWSSVLARCREVLSGSEFAPRVEGAKSVAVVYPDGSIQWWLHDLVSGMVCLATEPVLSEGEKSAIAEIKNFASEDGKSTSVVVDATGARLIDSVEIEWDFPYKVIPGFGVMVDKSDLI